MKKSIVIMAVLAALSWNWGCASPVKEEKMKEESVAGNNDGESRSQSVSEAESRDEDHEELSPDRSILEFGEPDMVKAELLDACGEYAALVESYAKGSSFKSVENDRVTDLKEYLSGHYEVAGRDGGDGREYYLAVRRTDAPVYGDFLEASVGYVSEASSQEEVCRIGYYYNEETDETVLYDVPGFSVNLFGDIASQDVFDMFCFIPTEASDDSSFFHALDEDGRMVLDFLKKHPGLSFHEGIEGCIDFYYQDEDTVKFSSEPYVCHISLDEGQQERIRQILEETGGQEKKEFNNEYEALLWARNQESSVRTTGIWLKLDGDEYKILGSRNHGWYLMSYGPDLVWLEENQEVSSQAMDVIKEVMGKDYGSFTDTWFDTPLASASLEFPMRQEKEDGTMTRTMGLQTVEEKEKLEHLGKILGNAIQGNEIFSGCPYTGVLNLVREDGETLQMFLAADSCDSIAYEGRIGFEYGEQKELAEIFDQVMK